MSMFDSFPIMNAYAVNLDWILKKIGEFKKDIEETNRNYNNMQQLFEELQAYVGNQIAEINAYVENQINEATISRIVNDKLEEMKNDGTLVEIFSNYFTWVSPINYGAVGDGVADDTVAVEKAFKRGFVVSPNGKSYVVTRTIDIDNFVTVKFGNSTIVDRKTWKLGSKEEQALLIFRNGCDITGLNIVGLNGEYWSNDIETIDIQFAMDAYGKCVLNNCKFADLWGYGVRIYNCATPSIDNCIFSNVGGKYKLNNEHDSFGDGVYLGTVDEKQFVKITNCKIYGKYVGSTFSRCGVTLEYNDKVDRKLELVNCDIQNYNRCVHIEQCGRVDVHTVNSDFKGDIIFFEIKGKDIRVRANGCVFKTTRNDYSGSFGLIRNGSIVMDSCKCNNFTAMCWNVGTENPVIICRNCEITVSANNGIGPAILHTSSCKGVFENCTVKLTEKPRFLAGSDSTFVLINTNIITSVQQEYSYNARTVCLESSAPNFANVHNVSVT